MVTTLVPARKQTGSMDLVGKRTETQQGIAPGLWLDVDFRPQLL